MKWDGVVFKLLVNSRIIHTPICFLCVQLQSIDPSKRPGAGPEGYRALRGHPFFHGVDWAKLRDLPPPKLVKEPRVAFSIVTMFYRFGS